MKNSMFKRFLVLFVLTLLPILLTAANAFSESVSVTSPNGGEVWGVGDTKRIQWSPTGTFTSFTTQVSRNGGSTWSTLESGLPGNYTYRDWVVTSPGSTSCRIKVIGYYSGGSVEDISNSNFTIGQLTVISPNGGETWQAGTTHDITWTHSSVTGNIQIQPYLNNSPQPNITTSAPNTGSYGWQIPEEYTPGTTYKIGISAMSGNVSDFSNANFTIVVKNPEPAVPTLSLPTNWQELSSGDVSFDWTDAANATKYRIKVSENQDMSGALVDQYATVSNYSQDGLAPSTYYWQVGAYNADNVVKWTGVWAFVVKNPEQPATGTISVTTNLSSATFDITGPANYSGSGTSWTKTGAPIGTYMITFNPVSDYNTSTDSPKTLIEGGLISFEGIYTPVGNGTFNKNNMALWYFP